MLTEPHHVGQWRKLAGNAYFNACRDAQDLKATMLPGPANINQKAGRLSGYLDRSFSPWNRCNKFSSQETLAFSRSSVCLRHYSAEPGAQSEMETSSQKQGLHESKIREELLSEAKAPTSEGVQSVRAQNGPVGPQGIGIEEDLTAEEAAILREAEIEYEKALKEGEGRAVSIDSLKQMLQELETSGDPNDARIAIIALRLGQEYESAGERPELFLSHGEQARKIFESCAPRFSAETAMCHHLIASAFHRMGQHDKSLESLNQALELLKDKEGKDYDPVKFAVHFLLGDTLAAFGKHEEALHHYCVGLSVQETVLDPGHPQLATNYRQVSLAFCC
jgi:tetratricopeptide (TPR) repeat protein